MTQDHRVEPFQVRTEERDGRLVLAMSGDLALETAAIVIAALDRAGEAISPEIVLDLREVSFTDRRTPRRRRLPARCSSRGWTASGLL